MKFCKNLQRLVEISDPEWAPYWTNYRMLKKIIKGLPSFNGIGNKDRSDSPASTVSSLSKEKNETSYSEKSEKHMQKDVVFQARAEVIASLSFSKTVTCTSKSLLKNDPLMNVKKMETNPGEVAFFKLLHSELRKAIQFFGKAEDEFTIREERVREGVALMKKNHRMMLGDRWSAVAKSLYRLYKDLMLLETFAIMNYCSFSKILKKHDKVTGYVTRNAFMENVVSKANFTNYPKVLAMIASCETLYEEVSKFLVSEGKQCLDEDERLFLNVIHNLNKQALDDADVAANFTNRIENGNQFVSKIFRKAEVNNKSSLQFAVEEDCSTKRALDMDDNEKSKRRRVDL